MGKELAIGKMMTVLKRKLSEWREITTRGSSRIRTINIFRISHKKNSID